MAAVTVPDVKVGVQEATSPKSGTVVCSPSPLSSVVLVAAIAVGDGGTIPSFDDSDGRLIHGSLVVVF